VRSVKRLGLILVVATAADLTSSTLPLTSAVRQSDRAQLTKAAVPIDFDAPYATGSFGFLNEAVGEASIVELGESIHVTAEFPRARLRIVRYLHEVSGFDVLALEGSLTQAWLAQEYLYRSKEPVAARVERAQQLAWFKLWNTVEMRELMAYVDAARATTTPLYLASFDVQTGASAEFGMQPSVLDALANALEAFGTAPADLHLTRRELTASLTPVVQCPIGSSVGLGVARQPALAAIDALQRWIERITPAVERERPAAHLAALRLIPDNLRDHLTLCEHAATWQRTRDELNAENALVLRDRVSASHRIILWAHHSHVCYNSAGAQTPSMGQHIRERVGRSVYTIGLFAGGGRFLDVAPLSVHDLPGVNNVGVERLLSSVGQPSYFVDLLRLPTDDVSAGWLVPQSSRMESRWTRSTVLARDFDGAIFIQRVSPGTGMIADGPMFVLRVFGFFVQHVVGTAIVLTMSMMLLSIRLFRRVSGRGRRKDGSRALSA
jgi:erythromycin esterase-like protein